MKRAALALTLMLTFLILVVASLLLSLASANPVPYPSTPNQDRPTLTIESPENSATYNESDVYLNFTVTKPDSWYDPQWPFVTYIGVSGPVEVYLDGNGVNCGRNNCNIFGNSVSYSIKMNQTESGPHTLNVTVLSYTYYRGPAYNGSHILSSIDSSSGPVYQYPIVVSDIIYFTVLGDPSSSPEPTLILDPNFGFYNGLTSLIIVVAIVAVALLVYFKKRKN